MSSARKFRRQHLVAIRHAVNKRARAQRRKLREEKRAKEMQIEHSTQDGKVWNTETPNA